MKTIHIYKAQDIGDKKVETLEIYLDHEIPRFEDLKTRIQVFEKEAFRLANVLCDTLPGGTLDQLICELLIRRASLFRVPMFEKKG